YSVTFSYVDRDIKGLEMDLPDERLDLEGLVGALNKNRLLIFKIVAEDQIAIALRRRLETVHGIVLDGSTRMPLEGASIHVSTYKAAITDGRGQFQLKDVSTDAVLNINYLGYVPQRIAIPQILGHAQDPAIILMRENEFEL